MGTHTETGDIHAVPDGLKFVNMAAECGVGGIQPAALDFDEVSVVRNADIAVASVPGLSVEQVVVPDLHAIGVRVRARLCSYVNARALL